MKPPKKIVIELMAVGNKRVLQRAVFAMEKGKRMGQGGIERILSKFSDDVIQKFPGLNYRIVPMVGHRYRFVNIPKTLAQLVVEATDGKVQAVRPQQIPA